MRDKKILMRLGVLLAAIVILAGLAFHPFASANPPSPPKPTPEKTLLQLDIEALQENPPALEQDTPRCGVGSTCVSTPAEDIFYATADAEIRQGYPTTNYGISTKMRCGYDDYYNPYGRIMRCLIKFDISSIPVGATINSAELYVGLVESWDFPGRTRTYTTYRIPSDWSEGTVTWSNAPSPAEAYGSADVTHDAWDWYSFDVTNLVRAWHDGTYPNFGVMLRGPEHSGSDSSWKAFSTKGAGRYTYGPRLVVDLDLPPPTLATATSSLEFINDASGPAMQTKELVVQNLSSDTLNWSATESVGWLSLDKTTGTVRHTLPDTIHVSVDKSGLIPGYYAAQIEITSTTPGVQGSPQIVDVTFDLSEELTRVYLPVVLRGGSAAPPQDVVALFIGISEYENMVPPTGQTSGRAGAPGFWNSHCYEDAVESASVMSNKGGLCSVSQVRIAGQCPSCSDVKILLDSWATKEAIRQAIIHWLDGQENKDTIVVIFFSGHGMYAPDDDGDEADEYDEFIAPYDIDCDPCYPAVETPVWLPETAIRDDEFDEWLDELESNRIVVIVDSCFSGGMAAGAAASDRGLLSKADPGTDVADLRAGDGFTQDVNSTGRVVLMASAEDQGSWEFNTLEHGVFTYYLIEALSSPSADANHNGWVSAEEAFNYLVGPVDSYAQPRTDYHQNPQVSDGVAGEVNLTQP